MYIPLHGISLSGFSNLYGFFLLSEDVLEPEEFRELDKFVRLRLPLLPNVPIIPLLLDEFTELLKDCTTATVVVPTTDFVVVTHVVDAVVRVVVAMVTIAQLSEIEVCGREPVEKDLTGASLTTTLIPDTTGFFSTSSYRLMSLALPLARPEGGERAESGFDVTESNCCEDTLFISILSTFTTGIE